ncbi:Protein-glutamine gamma-glutamyltransferase [Pirellulimonas nuda]|uniref:Protein-glutamine gamma-glutamyltransferase n=1 Tax=Pirellulimonas nuda TaxID=2528009 RepID=A0A518DJN7_9BACT|nr:transglutaminase family protein [Pirellulimonas nuda]QDU91691.1 Protein-glutamine gamma-glutamyltransferase [Pirellulimonas nuda]
MRYRVVHITRYLSENRVSVGFNEAWLRPLVGPGQELLRFQLRVSPEPSSQSERTDYFGNTVSVFSFYEGYEQLVVRAESEVCVAPPSVVAGRESEPWEGVRGSLPGLAATLPAVIELSIGSPRATASPAIAAYAAESFPPGRQVLAGALDLCRRVHADFKYEPGATVVTTPVEEAFDGRRGVCQDFAHIMLAALRSLGLPGAYVSGYLRTQPPPGKPRLVGADASHAWASVYCGALGWVDLDPTNDVITGQDHITVARGRDYGDVPPLRGVFIGGGQHTLEVSVDVEPLK